MNLDEWLATLPPPPPKVGHRADRVQRIWAEELPDHGTEERPQIPHGTLNGYTNYSCRCARCRAVMAAWQLDILPALEGQGFQHRIPPACWFAVRSRA
jgi:hypothetical protein